MFYAPQLTPNAPQLTRKWRRNPLESLKTDSEMARLRALTEALLV
jgi:hypothetical protein